ncbi:thioredoxin-dependent thiol peroxidase [soil metagenome]
MTGHPFTLVDQNDAPVSSDDFDGQRIVVFFYPKAMTPGCTGEACDFRDRYDQFGEAGYAVVGISPDPPAANAEFAAEHGLPFPLLSDPDHDVALRYGAWGTKRKFAEPGSTKYAVDRLRRAEDHGREYEGLIRSTFVLAPDHTIEHAWRNVRAKGHVARVARDLGITEA